MGDPLLEWRAVSGVGMQAAVPLNASIIGQLSPLVSPADIPPPPRTLLPQRSPLASSFLPSGDSRVL